MRRLLMLSALALVLPACSGGSGGGNASGSSLLPGGGTSTAVSSPQNGLLTASTAFTLGAGSRSYALPETGGVSGTMTTNATSVADGTMLTLTSELAPSTQTAQARVRQSDAVASSIFALQVSVSAGTVFGGLPGFTLQSERFRGVDAKSVHVILYGDVACTVPLAMADLSSIDGATATIAPGATPLTLDGTKIYTFVFTVAAPPVQSALFADAANNAVVAVDVTHAAATPAFTVISGGKTMLDGPQEVASGPGGEIVVLNREVYPDGGLDFGNYYLTTSSALVFPRNAAANSAPAQVIDASGDVYTHLSTSPSGVVYAWSNGFGTGSLAGLKYLLGTVTRTYTNAQVPQQGIYLAFDSLTPSADGTLAYSGSEAATTGFFDALCIAQVCSQAPPFDPHTNAPQPTPYYDYKSMAFNPAGTQIYGAVPAAKGAVIDIYPAQGFVLDQPTGHLTLPAAFTRVDAVQFDLAGTLYAYGRLTGGDRAVAVYDAAGLASAQSSRVIDVEPALAGRVTAGFAVQVR